MAKTDTGEKLFQIFERGIRTPFDFAGKLLIRALRLVWRDRPAPVDHPKHPTHELPAGPFDLRREKQRGDLLLFVPRGWDSRLIDDLTGGYGYSHVAVDCGEDDASTGKAVMVESMVGVKVRRVFLRQYGERPFVRIPLRKAGVDPVAFCSCITAKIGEPYDVLEALTLGEIDDPAKQICSDLAADCLPEWMRQDIARMKKLGVIKGLAVSLHSRQTDHQVREFISPNGFAEYFQAPRGKQVLVADQTVDPRPLGLTSPHALIKFSSKLATGVILLTCGWIAYRRLSVSKK